MKKHETLANMNTDIDSLRIRSSQTDLNLQVCILQIMVEDQLSQFKTGESEAQNLFEAV